MWSEKEKKDLEKLTEHLERFDFPAGPAGNLLFQFREVLMYVEDEEHENASKCLRNMASLQFWRDK